MVQKGGVRCSFSSLVGVNAELLPLSAQRGVLVLRVFLRGRQPQVVVADGSPEFFCTASGEVAVR